MDRRSALCGLITLLGNLTGLSACVATPPDERPRSPGRGVVRAWRQDPVFLQMAAALDPVWAVDNHTHLLKEPAFDPTLDEVMPLGLRSRSPAILDALAERFGVDPRRDFEAAVERATRERASRINSVGKLRYMQDHLDSTRTRVALVNQSEREGVDGQRLRWVPDASCLLYPLPAERLMERHASARTDIENAQKSLGSFLKEGGVDAAPADLAGYLRFVDETLDRWRTQGAVAVKFWDGYVRTLRFEEIPADRARDLYARGGGQTLSREEYLELQDHIAWHVFRAAGPRRLPVHIHSSSGVPPFLRLHETDVRNLENVLTDPTLFGTQFVLIHGGHPAIREAAYLGLKPHVWLDVSSMPFLYPVPDLALVLREYLVMAPGKVLFGTDVGDFPGVPVGPELQHAALSKQLREALYLALTGLVADGVVDAPTAVGMGRDALHGNADRLYGWKAPPGG